MYNQNHNDLLDRICELRELIPNGGNDSSNADFDKFAKHKAVITATTPQNRTKRSMLTRPMTTVQTHREIERERERASERERLTFRMGK